jgi:hypothetical protein
VSALRVRVAPSEIRLAWSPRRGTRRHAVLSWPTLEALRPTLAHAATLADFPKAAVADVVLAGRLLQHRTLQGLPRVRAHALNQIVALHQSQYFRRNGHPLVTAARWDQSGVGTGAARATAIAAEAEILEAIEQGLAAAGVRVRAIRCGRSGLRLEAPTRTQRAVARRRRWQRLLLLGNALIWMAAFGVHVGRLVVAERRLGAELITLAPAATAFREARRAVALAHAQVDSVRGSERRRDRMVALLVRVATTLPDSAYLATVVLDQHGNGFLTGSARPAAGLVAALERGGWPASVALEGEPTPDGSTGWERFTLRLGRGGAP